MSKEPFGKEFTEKTCAAVLGFLEEKIAVFEKAKLFMANLYKKMKTILTT